MNIDINKVEFGRKKLAENGLFNSNLTIASITMQSQQKKKKIQF